MSKYRDLAARAGWTALQAGLAVVTVEALDVPLAIAPLVATALSMLKSWVATKVGNPSTVTFFGSLRNGGRVTGAPSAGVHVHVPGGEMDESAVVGAVRRAFRHGHRLT